MVFESCASTRAPHEPLSGDLMSEQPIELSCSVLITLLLFLSSSLLFLLPSLPKKVCAALSKPAN